jgi:transcription antitermination factor NusG
MATVLAPKDQWFVVHVLSGQENKVRDNIAKRVKTGGDERCRLRSARPD